SINFEFVPEGPNVGSQWAWLFPLLRRSKTWSRTCANNLSKHFAPTNIGLLRYNRPRSILNSSRRDPMLVATTRGDEPCSVGAKSGIGDARIICRNILPLPNIGLLRSNRPRFL